MYVLIDNNTGKFHDGNDFTADLENAFIYHSKCRASFEGNYNTLPVTTRTKIEYSNTAIATCFTARIDEELNLAEPLTTEDLQKAKLFLNLAELDDHLNKFLYDFSTLSIYPVITRSVPVILPLSKHS